MILLYGLRNSLRESCFFMVFIIIFGSSVYLGQAQNASDCIIYSYNATTDDLECVDKNNADFDSNSSSSVSSDIGPIKYFVMVANILAVICGVIRWYKLCSSPSPRRCGYGHDDEDNSANPEQMSTFPEVVFDPELPQYEPPPSYDECVINVGGNDDKKF